MFGMDPGAVPEPAEYSSPPSPRSNAGMGEEEVIEVPALIEMIQFKNIVLHNRQTIYMHCIFYLYENIRDIFNDLILFPSSHLHLL